MRPPRHPHGDGGDQAHLCPHVPDYHSRLPENTAPYGHTLFPQAPNGEPGKGPEMIRHFLQVARERGIPIRTKHRVGAVVVEADGAGVGVLANNEGQEVAFRARHGVIFASGGFTHNGLTILFRAKPALSSQTAPLARLLER